jgi:ribose transport system permease protein
MANGEESRRLGLESRDAEESTGATTGGSRASEPPAPHAALRLAPPVRRLGSEGVVRWLIEAESNSVLIALIVVLAVFGIAHPAFFDWQSLRDVLQSAVPYGLLAMGASFLIMMGQLDLSVGAIVGLTIVVTSLVMNAGLTPWIAALIGLFSSVGMGLVNAFLVQAIAIPALLATLAMGFVYSGLANGIANSAPVTLDSTRGTFFNGLGGEALGLPVSVWALVIVTIVLTGVLRFTPFGYRTRSIGSNPEAAQFSGISIPRVKVQAFVLAALLSGLAAVLYLAFFQDGDPTLGTDWALFAIAAAIIGGTPMRGGSGTMIGAVLGGILLAAVQSGLVYFNIPQAWTSFALGVVIVAAVTIDAAVRRGTRGRGAPLQ